MMTNSFIRGLTAAAALLCSAAVAQAATIDNWTFTGPGSTSITQDGDDALFSYNLSPAPLSRDVIWTATGTVQDTGTYTFD